MRTLVVGGAGYIGSVVSAHLLRAGHQVTVVDDVDVVGGLVGGLEAPVEGDGFGCVHGG